MERAYNFSDLTVSAIAEKKARGLLLMAANTEPEPEPMACPWADCPHGADCVHATRQEDK